MKRVICILFALLVGMAAAGCGSGPQETASDSEATVDIDLTAMSATVVYSEVYNMMMTPQDYLGKTVKMRGTVATTQGNGRTYYACIISDATACCQQGIEFVLNDSYQTSEYPSPEDEVVVTGTFDRYYEGEQAYIQLKDAAME